MADIQQSAENNSENKQLMPHLSDAIPLAKIDIQLSHPAFNPDDYRNDLSDCDLTTQQQNEILQTLWNFIRAMVDIGWGLDSAQKFLAAFTHEISQAADQYGNDKEHNRFNAHAQDKKGSHHE